MSKSKSSTRQRLARAGFAAGAATTLVAALTSAPAFAAAGTLNLSSAGGPAGGGNTIVATLATTPTTPNPTTFTSSTAAYFVIATSATATPTCPSAYPSSPASNVTASGSPAIKLLASNKIAIVVPAGVTVTSSIYKYAVCTFASATANAALIASGSYTVGTAPRIAAAGGISPVSGPALGGTTVTVKGSGFVSGNTTATIDGQPITNITVAGDGNSFSGTTPAHAPTTTPVLLAVTTPAGTVNTLGTTTNKATLFNYTNGIVVSPNTAPNYNGSVDLDVLGVGFSSYTFQATNGNTPNSADAHVYLSMGTHDSTSASGAKTVAEKTECINVLVIADTELLCSLPLNHTYDNPTTGTPAIVVGSSAYAQRTAKNLVATAGSTAVTSTNGAFTQADVGLPITSAAGTTIVPAGTTIASVASPTSATMSTAALLSGTVSDATIGGPRTISTANTATSTTIVGAANTFTSADIGRIVTSATLPSSATPPAPGIPDNTTIIAVNSTGTTATLSAPLTGTISTSTAYTDIVVTQSNPVTNGTYTIAVVSNGAVGGTPTQSIISSGSTFTVADY